MACNRNRLFSCTHGTLLQTNAEIAGIIDCDVHSARANSNGVNSETFQYT